MHRILVGSHGGRYVASASAIRLPSPRSKRSPSGRTHFGCPSCRTRRHSSLGPSSTLIGYSPISQLPVARLLSGKRSFQYRNVLDVAVEIETPVASFASDAGIAAAAKRGRKLANEEAVDPHRAGCHA